MNGLRLCALQASQELPEPARTADGGIIVGWEDGRGKPNPFVSRAQFELVLAAPREVMVEVLDLSGRRVRTLAHGLLPAGARTFTWDGRTESGAEAPTGLYFARAHGASFELRVKLVRLR